MTIIREEDIVQSVADALQFISCYHPADYVRHLSAAHEREESPAAKEAIGQILMNSRMAALGHRPMCQDTGTVNAFVRVGLRARIETTRSLEALIDEGVRRAYLDAANPLRASIIMDPLFSRRNTRDNTPAVTHTSVVPGDGVTITVMAKGGGSENKSRFAMLNPSDDLVDWVVETVRDARRRLVPARHDWPRRRRQRREGDADGEGIAVRPDRHERICWRAVHATPKKRSGSSFTEKINALGIGAQGLGGLTTVVDVKLRTFPTHAASKPVGLIPQCAANRHVTFTLDGTGPVALTPPSMSDWPQSHARALGPCGAARRPR